MFRSMIRWLVLAVVSGAVGFGQTAVTEQSIAAKLQGALCDASGDVRRGQAEL